MPSLDDLLPARAPSQERPLAGLTLLLAEDSRLACEAMRLICRRSGARLRRADTLEAAQRHLRAYRPDAVMADIHLPDGSGLRLIEGLSQARPRLDGLLAISGDPTQEAPARAAGADGFLLKPAGLGAFQAAVLACLPPHRRPPGHPAPPEANPPPDLSAFREDLEHADALLGSPRFKLDYVTGFVAGVARSAGDRELLEAAQSAASTRRAARLRMLLRARLALQPAI
jgi:DNA-binding response OmpR family regulator